ncbi:MAG: hypothetical protein AABY22_16325 [Nanoarchaeota archaeon]
MSELKTLKDLYGETKLISPSELRSAAIIWIKHIHPNSFPIFPSGREVEIPWFGEELTLYNGDMIFGAKAVLKSFFGITNEELEQ